MTFVGEIGLEDNGVWIEAKVQALRWWIEGTVK